MSLWKVPDLPTTILMECFYENLVHGRLVRAESLRKAQHHVRTLTVGAIRDNWLSTAMIDRLADGNAKAEVDLRDLASQPDAHQPFTDPYYWGAFVCLGNPALLNSSNFYTSLYKYNKECSQESLESIKPTLRTAGLPMIISGVGWAICFFIVSLSLILMPDEKKTRAFQDPVLAPLMTNYSIEISNYALIIGMNFAFCVIYIAYQPDKPNLALVYDRHHSGIFNVLICFSVLSGLIITFVLAPALSPNEIPLREPLQRSVIGGLAGYFAGRFSHWITFKFWKPPSTT